MKNKILIIFSISFIFTMNLKADTSELEKLKAEHKASIKKIIDAYESDLKKIDLAYLKKLAEYKKVFIKKGDLDAAVAVRDEINNFKEKLGIFENHERNTSEHKKVEENKVYNNTETSNKDDDKDVDKDQKDKDDDKAFGEEEF